MDELKKEKKSNYSRVIIATCALMLFVGLGFCSSSKGIFLNPILHNTGLDRGPYAFSDSFRYITTAVVNIFFGVLIVKLGVKMLVGLGFLALSGSMVLYAVSNQLWSFYIAGALLGLGLAWTTTTMVGYIINKWVSKNRGTVMGFILATNGLGGALAVNVFTPIIESGATGYKTAYFIIAMVVALVGVITVLFIKDKKAETDETVKKEPKGDNWVGIDTKTAFKKPYFFWAMVGIFITGLVLQSITGVFHAHMENVKIETGLRTIITTVSMFILTCTKFLVGFVYDKKGLRLTMTITFICSILAMVSLAFIEPTPFGNALCFIYVILADTALPLETIMLPIYAGDLFGRKDYPKFLGLCVSVNTAGYALGSPIMGFVYDAFGSYVPAFFVGAGLMLVTIVIMQFVLNSANKEKIRVAQLQKGKSENIA